MTKKACQTAPTFLLMVRSVAKQRVSNHAGPKPILRDAAARAAQDEAEFVVRSFPRKGNPVAPCRASLGPRLRGDERRKADFNCQTAKLSVSSCPHSLRASRLGTQCLTIGMAGTSPAMTKKACQMAKRHRPVFCQATGAPVSFSLSLIPRERSAVRRTIKSIRTAAVEACEACLPARAACGANLVASKDRHARAQRRSTGGDFGPWDRASGSGACPTQAAFNASSAPRPAI